MNSTLPKIGLA